MSTARRPVVSSFTPLWSVSVRRVGGAGLLALLLLVSCAKGDDQPGQITADDQRQLNEAAAMLDANSVDANELPTDNESEP